MLRCKDCGATKNLTRHSEIGHHIPPYIPLCLNCHRKRHGIRLKHKIPGKYQPGTPKCKRK